MRRCNNRLVYWLYAMINMVGGRTFTIKRHQLHSVDPTFKYDIEVHGGEAALHQLRTKLIVKLVLKGFKEGCVQGSYIKEAGTHFELVMFGHIGRDVYGHAAPSMLLIGTSVFSNESFENEPRPNECENQQEVELLEL